MPQWTNIIRWEKDIYTPLYVGIHIYTFSFLSSRQFVIEQFFLSSLIFFLSFSSFILFFFFSSSFLMERWLHRCRYLSKITARRFNHAWAARANRRRWWDTYMYEFIHTYIIYTFIDTCIHTLQFASTLGFYLFMPRLYSVLMKNTDGQVVLALAYTG